VIPVDGAQAAAHWLQANRTAIASIHDAKARAAAQKTLDATLARMRAQRAVAAPSGDPRAAAARELATFGRYDLSQTSGKPRVKTPWERFWSWVGDQYDRFWKAFGGNVHLGVPGLNVLGDLFLAVAIGGLLFVAVRLLANITMENTRKRGVASALESGRNAHALYLQACGLAASGAFAEAARTLFLAAVTALDLRGVVRDDAAATVGEMRRTLRARNAGAVPSFDDVAAPFVVAAYAEREVARADWERALEGYRSLVRIETPT
jgi:hypothetical protein